MSWIPRVRNALFFSDVHLGWAVCSRHHASWLDRLPEAVDDAELVVLNGDVIDGYRRVHRAAERDLVQRLGELVVCWRAEGRRVVYLAGNHDEHSAASAALCPERWLLDFETEGGARVRVLHGHRFAASDAGLSAYDRVGRAVLGSENFLYGRVAALQSLYRFGPGWLVSGFCALECLLARRALPAQVSPLTPDVDVLLHGHVHYGPGRGQIGRVATWRTGAFVSPGHLGSADRMLRYRKGRFERIGWSGEGWRAFDDGR